MFTASLVGGVAYVASPIPRFVGVEVVETLLTATRQRTVVTVMRVKAVIDMAIKAVRAVEPRAGSKEDPADKPVRSIVAVGRTIVRSVVEVAVGANGRHSDADSNLRRPQRCTTEQRNGEN
jgi:hypothetical protein